MNTTLAQASLPGDRSLQLVEGDITFEDTEAIVNAANRELQHAGGLALAIVQRGGAVIQKESDAWIRNHGRVSHAEPAWTSAGNLLARYVIHAVGPIWGSGDETAKLSSAVEGSLRVADGFSLKSIALPAISTGIFGFPKQLAADIIFSTIEQFFSVNGRSSLNTIHVVLFDPATIEVFLKVWHARWGP